MRTADKIEEQNAQHESSDSSRKGIGRGNHPNSRAALRPKPWPKGVSANPGGRRKDIASEIARIIFEQNYKTIYEGLASKLIEGNAYTFKELAERAFGKLKEHVEHSGDDALLAALALGRKRVNNGD